VPLAAFHVLISSKVLAHVRRLIRRCYADLSMMTLDMWRQADIRIGMAALLREQEEAEARRGAVEEQRTPLGNYAMRYWKL
jgi:hypothetical protein